MVRLFGCGLLALTFASTGWAAEHYVEVWNPPEARLPAARTPSRTPGARPGADAHAAKGAEKHASAQSKAIAKPPHKRRVAQALKAEPHRAPAAVDTPVAPRPVEQPAPGRLTVMQPAAPDAPHALDFSDIPRQYTPDGNVLRVGTRPGAAEVTR
ncbi:hypothetical protein KTE45_16955 [Burkholderia multivorans]|uniref:hypothetical protein n=1 Tax=Burkholderia multivorans TaxID=87883 RepID=UPI0004F5FB8A|nr:hypothetical protein [Burkholderia multivorans]AIO75279.1 hypothetical protein DM80_1938 [Burkholderia multivorans]AOK68785.1 hypothetical protein WM33_25280 [Burkholderia multivorans]KVZ78995.1 hypothetical protein WL23_16285 [Burkholderia multivorans]MBU9390410.1 hypothetical protein [Burkholderia multivorans]MBU9444848.1 hypothetical protein [Burkholderia multivorans]